MNTLAESSFAEAKIDPGDYTIQTLIDTLNDQLVMPLNSNVNNCNVNIVVSSVTNPPDIQNKIQFYSAYPFMFDMKRSTIAESLGFDTYIQSSEKNKTNLDKDYVPFFFTDGVYITSNDVINVYTSLKFVFTLFFLYPVVTRDKKQITEQYLIITKWQELVL